MEILFFFKVQFILTPLCLGPGPARYKLPACLGYTGHVDLTKRIMPAHTFGRKLDTSCKLGYANVGITNYKINELKILVFKSECSPGPAYHVQHQITRFGMDGTPKYSMLGRSKDGSKTNLQNLLFNSFLHHWVMSN